MSDDEYLTIGGASEGLYKEKGSKFLGFAYAVEDEAQVKEIIDILKKAHHNARHHCFAFILGSHGEHYRANDAGEPSHTAGDPILGQIRSRNLTNTLVVVVRYFGGTKLGVPGLINAYKSAAADALNNAPIIKKVITEPICIRFDYPAMNDVMRIVNEKNLKIHEQQFEIDCRMHLSVPLSQAEEIRSRLLLIKSVELLF